MKRAALILLTFLALCMVALIVVPGLIDWNKYKGEIQTQIKTMTGYDVDIRGDLRLSLLPEPTLHIADTHVSAAGGEFASFERLDVHAQPGPLLSGELVISSIDLVKPDIALRVSEQGAQNWASPKMQAMVEDAGGQKPVMQAEPGSDGFLRSVSLENINIEGGRFSYADAKAAQPMVIEDVNLKVKAQTLKGPFNVDGALVYGGQALDIKAAVGEMAPDAKSVSVNAQVGYNGLNVNYAGAVALAEPFGAQGEAAIGTQTLSKTLANFGAKGYAFSPDTAQIKGLVTASAEGVVFKDASLDIAGQTLAADLSVKFSPMNVQGRFSAGQPFNLDPFLVKAGGGSGGAAGGGAGGGSGSGTSGFDAANLMPVKIDLPTNMNVNIAAMLPGVIYKGQNLGPADLKVSLENGRLLANLALSQMPGPGEIAAIADLAGGDKPALYLSGTASSKDLPATLKVLSGQESAIGFKTVSAKFDALVVPGKVQVRDSTVTLDGQSYVISGVLDGQNLLANVGAYGGQVSVQSKMADGDFFKDATVQVKHPNLAQGIQKLTKAPTANPMLAQPVDFYTKVAQDGTKFNLTDIKAKLGDAAVTGSMMYDGGSGKPNVTGSFKAGDLDLSGAKGSSGAGGAGAKGAVSGGAGGGSSARWSNDPIDTKWLDAANADISLEANRLKFGPWDMTAPKLAFVLKDGVLDVKNLAAGLYGGSVSANATLKADAAQALNVSGAAEVSGVQLEPMIKSLVGLPLLKGKGSVNMKTSLATTGKSQAQMIRALDGQGTLSATGLVLEGFDLTRFVRALSDELKPGDTLTGLWKGVSKGGSTSFDTADGAYVVEDGIVKITKLDLDSATLAMNTTGIVDLPQWQIKTAHKLTLKQETEVPPFTINIAGSLDNPGQTFAEGALQDYVTRKLNRKLEKLLTDKLGNDQMGKALGGAIGNILGAYPGALSPQQQDNTAPSQPQAPAQPQGEQPQQQAPAQPQGEQPQQQQAPAQQDASPEETFNNLLKGLVN